MVLIDVFRLNFDWIVLPIHTGPPVRGNIGLQNPRSAVVITRVIYYSLEVEDLPLRLPPLRYYQGLK